MTLARPLVFTIGHSNHSEAVFLELLKKFDIDVLLDVRSSPQSRFSPQYNKETIATTLEHHGVRYTFGGDKLGGRPKSRAFYQDGQVSYARMLESKDLLDSLKKVSIVARSHRIALMCSEADPADCHRFLLLGRRLTEADCNVLHILPNARSESQRDVEARIVKGLQLEQADIFGGNHDVIETAYVAQERKVAFRLYSVQKDDAIT